MHTEDGGVPGADAPTEARPEPWRDPSLPVPTRVDSLLNAMNLEEKVAQLYAVWVGVDPDSQDVAPHQHELADTSVEFAELVRSGLGQLTRPLGTAPVAPAEGVKILARLQQDVVAANRFGIPALVHEECLTGFMTRGATIYPTPLAWGATFDPVLVERMAAQIGDAIRAVGGHQGLAPVLDVTLDARWGRTEETIGEDPYLVGTIGTAHVIGLQSTGVVATLKHFAGYSASNAARNLGPVAVGPRQMADLLLLPFEMAVRNGGAKSVMSAYTETDGVPVAADRTLLTDLLRDTWGFAGTVVADYFGVSFLETLHRVAAAAGEAGVLAVTSGVDVELPSVRCYGPPLLDAVRSGVVAEEVIDRAAERVLRQKCELGLLDPDWSALLRRCGTPAGTAASTSIHRPPGRLPADWLRSRSSCSRTAAHCRCAAPRGSRSSGRTRTMRTRCSAATRSPAMSTARPARSVQGWESRSVPSCNRCVTSWAAPRSSTSRAATSPGTTPPDSAQRWMRHDRPTSASPSSATVRACSVVARPARDATSKTSGCRVCKESCSTSSSAVARRSFWYC